MTDDIGLMEDVGELTLSTLYQRIVKVPQPAAGAEWTQTVPAIGRWRLKSVIATFASSAVIAARVARLAMSDGSTQYQLASSQTTQAAGGTKTYSWYPAAGLNTNWSTGDTVQCPIPDLWLMPGHVISSSTYLIDVGDQWSAIVLVVDEERTGPPAPRQIVRAIRRY